MKIGQTEAFESALMGMPPIRAFAALDALDQVKMAPQSVGLRPVQGYDRHFTIDTRQGDRIILRLDNDGVYIAVDAGPYASVMRRLGQRL